MFTFFRLDFQKTTAARSQAEPAKPGNELR